MQALAKMILRWIGWKIKGQMPDKKKFVLIVAPHTSNWDTIIGLLGRYAVGIQPKFIAKKEVFFFPLGPILKAVGGIPLDRSKHHNLVEQMVELFKDKDEFILGLTPEGTRSPVKRWKTGFYHIAEKADVPIAMVGFDYPKKEIIIREPFWTTGDIEKDFEDILKFHRSIEGRYPKKIPDFNKPEKEKSK